MHPNTLVQHHPDQLPIIDIIAPGGKIKDPTEITKLEKFLESWGYQARLGKHIQNHHAFLSNTTENRFEDLYTALTNSDSHIIWCYRGGSGCSELLPLLAKAKKPKQPKIFLGFSDITALHIFLTQHWGWTTYHGPNARQTAVGEVDPESTKRVKSLFENNIILPPLLNLSGKFIGGNLSIITSLLGTPYQIKTDNKILFLEELNEPAYKIRRMLHQLDQSGLLNNLNTLVIGEFIHKNPEEKKLINQEIKDFLENLEYKKNIHYPIRMASHIGHGKTNYIIPVN